jgi:hypothetical protein
VGGKGEGIGLAPVGWVAFFNPTDPTAIFINQVYTAPTAINIRLISFLQ